MSHKILAAIAGGSIIYSSWVALHPLTKEELDSWNSIYLEDKTLLHRAYLRAPLNAASRLVGRLAHLRLPEFTRAPIYSAFASCYGCNLDEAASGASLADYPCFSDFFRRELKPGARPVSRGSCVVSPADGVVLSLGRVGPDGRLDQVKGISYSLQGFLGPQPTATATPAAGQSPPKQPSSRRVPDSAYYSELFLAEQPSLSSAAVASADSHRCLYHCVVYLSPGDYHRFHAPADWRIAKRRHFPGYLMSVSPVKAARLRGLFCLNERVVYLGDWRHGFFAFAAVGATNVGSIGVYEDPELRTNGERPLAAYRDRDFPRPLNQEKGRLFGEFDMGSTIVLVFEAPREFAFAVGAGDRVKVGQAIGTA